MGAEALRETLLARAHERKQAYKKLSSDDLGALFVYMRSLRPDHEQAVQTGSDR